MRKSQLQRLLILVCISLGLYVIQPLPYEGVLSSLRTKQNDEMEWAEFHADAVEEYEDEFTALFNSYETKWSKNGRLMIRQGDSGSFKFVKRAA